MKRATTKTKFTSTITSAIVAMIGLLSLLAVNIPVVSVVSAVASDYIPLAPLPGTTKGQCDIGNAPNTSITDDPNQNALCKTDLVTYLKGIYKITISGAGILAVVMIIFNGFKYTMGIAEPTKAQAKEGIGNAVIGLVLVLSSALILNFINPSLTNIKLKLENKPPDTVGGQNPSDMSMSPDENDEDIKKEMEIKDSLEARKKEEADLEEDIAKDYGIARFKDESDADYNKRAAAELKKQSDKAAGQENSGPGEDDILSQIEDDVNDQRTAAEKAAEKSIKDREKTGPVTSQISIDATRYRKEVSDGAKNIRQLIDQGMISQAKVEIQKLDQRANYIYDKELVPVNKDGQGIPFWNFYKEERNLNNQLLERKIAALCKDPANKSAYKECR